MTMHRPTRAVISLEAVRHNVRVIQEKIGQDRIVMAIVKADAYGHGMIPVAKAAFEAGAGWLGIATVDEAVCLRETGISKPVLLLGPSFPGDAETLVENNISAAVGSLRILKALNSAAEKMNKSARIHLKVDTGMGRFGFFPDDLIKLFPEIKNNKNLILEGCFSHFAVSDSLDFEFTRKQHQNMKRFLNTAQKENVSFNFIHIANSGAILQHPDTYYNMVRAGVILYGMLPDTETEMTVPLKPVMTLMTKLVELRNIPEGHFVSYGCTYKTTRKSRIGIMPIGYGDGLSRKLSNRGEVIIRGRRSPIVGRVCMDQVMIDLTDIPEAQPGDDILLWGKNGSDELKAEEVSKWAETITYDITCALTPRIPRIYI